MKNYASSMITDMVNPDNKMFHNEGWPPIYVKMTTCTTPSEITQFSLARILEYLTEFIEPDCFEWHQTDSILSKKSGELRLDLNTLLVHLAYEDVPDRTMSFQLSLSAAELVLN
jgi:hypothetical protein